MEAAGNLDNISARAAALTVGGPKIAGAMGGPTRLIALVPRRSDDD
jgi:kynurenine formamidase